MTWNLEDFVGASLTLPGVFVVTFGGEQGHVVTAHGVSFCPCVRGDGTTGVERQGSERR